jgi:hypothetical protein
MMAFPTGIISFGSPIAHDPIKRTFLAKWCLANPRGTSFSWPSVGVIGNTSSHSKRTNGQIRPAINILLAFFVAA